MKRLTTIALWIVTLALSAAPQYAKADSMSEVDAALNSLSTAIADSSVAMGTGCEKQLNNNGVGSTCSCNVSGGNPSCSCSGSGNNMVCSCSDGRTITYCYYCDNGSGCECGPTNRSGKKCRGINASVAAPGDISNNAL